MITNKELQISNKSYTNKDFASVYPELIENVTKISDRWDPTTSNESDPGIVLLKENAFAVDKLSYNMDKNVLESYLPSATQENSTKMLCEMNGYNMKYYQSAMTGLTFTYLGTLENNKSFTLKKYETVVKSEDDSINYTLIQNCTISYQGVAVGPVTAIEGTVEKLIVGDSSTIELSNLDENNRIYFPESMIAENGIFVYDIDTENEWSVVSNLNTQVLGNKVFKFGYDSNQKLPYIEFPEDVSSLIGNGLNIYYTITSGVNGNVSASTLTTISKPSSILRDGRSESEAESSDYISDLVDNLSVTNLSASSNGANPETVESAYNNYKKTVGTFDTLITSRDYSNFIYNINDEATGNPIVSNVQTADRRTDFNYGNNVTTYETSTGVYKKSNTKPTGNKAITPYDLCLYPLKPITTSYNQDTFEDSFTPQTFNIVSEDPNLEESKCLSHNFKEASVNDVYCFKNKYTMDIKLSTYKKLNAYSQALLVANVKQALYKAFNARMVDFGEEIPIESIKKVIKEADSGISDIAIFNVDVATYTMDKNGAETLLTDDSNADVVNDLVAKNVLNGSISLFDYNDSYVIELGQKKISGNVISPSYSDVKTANTEVKIPFNEAPVNYDLFGENNYLANGYTLKANEAIQFIAPNLTTEIQYGQYVNYRFEGTAAIEKDSVHQLTGNECLKIVYTDANTNTEYKIVYTANTTSVNGNLTTGVNNIIKPNFKLEVMDDTSTTLTTITKDGVKYLVLGANQTIDKQIYSKTTIDSSTLYCYWIMNNDTNSLFTTTRYRNILLDSGEYFIYTNATQSELTILGSGTRLSLSKAPSADWTINSDNILDIEDISDKGLSAFTTSNWHYEQSLSSNPLTIEEIQIITFAEGDNLTISNYGQKDSEGRSIIYTDPATSKETIDHLGNNWLDLPTGTIVSGTSNGAAITLPNLYLTNVHWNVRSRLGLNAGPTLEQFIRYNHFIDLIDLYQTHYLYDNTRKWFNTSYNVAYLKFNALIQSSGGIGIPVSSDLVNALLGDDGVTAIAYEVIDVVYPENNSSNPEIKRLSKAAISRNSKGMLPILLKGFGNGVSTSEHTSLPKMVVNLLPIVGKDEYLLLQYDPQSTEHTVAEIGLTVQTFNLNGPANGELYNTGVSGSSPMTLKSGLNILKLPSTSQITKLEFSHNLDLTTNDTLYLGKIKVTNGFNTIIPSSVDMSSVLELISDYASVEGETTSEGVETKDIFYYLNEPDNDKVMDADNILSPEAFWDYNNVANPFVIGELNFKTSSIDLIKSSKA